MAPAASTVPKYTVSTDQARLELGWIVTQIQGSYWGAHMASETICGAVANSLCFGAYADNRQVGMVRVVTDHGIFSSITDAIVEEGLRGQGVGTALMRAVIEHPSVAGTYCVLRSRPENQRFYSRFNFQLFDERHGLMHRGPG